MILGFLQPGLLRPFTVGRRLYGLGDPLAHGRAYGLDGQRRVFRDLGGEIERFRAKRLEIGQYVRHPPGVGGLAVDAATGHEHQVGVLLADQSRQRIGQAETGVEPELHEVRSEAGLRAHHTKVREQCQAKTAADRGTLDGADDRLAKFRNKNIGFIFQFHHLLPEFTALENVSIPQMISGISLSDAAKKSKKLLGTVGLSERMEHKPAELSGGEQQRVAVARALANDPQIIFGDEPTGNLDSKNSESIHQLILELHDTLKVTFVIVTHNPNLVKLADKVFEIRDGKVFGM